MSTPQALTLVQLSCFVAVVDTGSFAEAARQLAMTTSGVSKIIARLEAARSIRLLNRSTHALSLTPEGELLLPLARDALREVEKVETALSLASVKGATGRVRLSAPTAFLSACLVPLLPRLREALPDITLDLRGSDAMVDLADGAVDLALRTGVIRGIPGHKSQLLFTFPWVTCASPGYLAKRPEPSAPEDLQRHDLIGFLNKRTGIVDPWRFRRPGADQPETIRVVPSPAVVLDDANAVVAAAIAGVGIAWTPRWLVSAALDTGTLTPILGDWRVEEMKMSLIRREGRISDRTKRIIAFLKAHCW